MLKEFDQDTIAAISTPPGEGGIGIVRLSGPQAIMIADQLFVTRHGTKVSNQKSFTVQLGTVVSQKNSKKTQVIDEVLLLLMRAPKSYTCQDVVEISAHGGTVVLQAILELAIQAGARLAAPGEFTKRAFMNGRLDLLQAEAVLDLIHAKTELGRQWAASQLEGNLSRRMKELKKELIDILSHLEASIDFPDDFPETESLPEISQRLRKIEEYLKILLADSEMGRVAKDGLKTVLVGRPNVGKSSLMNRLCHQNRVIVSPYPGTTRDVVEETIQIQGFPIRLLDTAGIQDTEHPIEKEGIEQSRKMIRGADLLLCILDGSQVMVREDQELLESMGNKKKIVVVNKSDLGQKLEIKIIKEWVGSDPIIGSSCVSENGTKELENAIFRFISGGRQEIPSETMVSSIRQKNFLEKTLASIEESRVACEKQLSPEFCAADVRVAMGYLGELVGEVVTEDVLEAIFSQFCIGK